jgi:putative hydrolase of the HAD superfamily
VCFDIDDTLVDYTGAARDGLDSWLAAQGLTGSDRIHLLWRDLDRRHFGAFTRGLIGFTEQRRLRCRDFCVAIGHPVPRSDAEADSWYAGYAERLDAALRLHDDVLPLLDALDAAGVAIAAVSNGDHAQQDAKLRRLGIRDRVRTLVCVDDAGGTGKPAPRIFHVGCDRLRLAPARVAYIGDRLDIDARAAGRAGLAGVWLDRGRDPHAATVTDVVVLHRLDHLPAALAAAGRPLRGDRT